MHSNALISIVTPSFNQGSFIEQTILSVLEQSYKPIEYIVVDGGSTDGTLDILRRYEGRLRWISEPDQGQADAINKGFRLATGQIFGWLNTDDRYTPGALQTVAEYFANHPECDFVYGDAVALDKNGKSFGIRTHVSQTNFHILVNELDNIVQPAAFWRRILWETTGELDSSLVYTLDYEYWMRAAKQFRFDYIPVGLAQERLYENAKTFTGGLSRLQEIERVAVKHGGQGIPASFRKEAKATYSVEATKLLLKGRWNEARSWFIKAYNVRCSPRLYVPYFLILLFWGYGGLARVWLRLNLMRQQRKRDVTFPQGIPPYP